MNPNATSRLMINIALQDLIESSLKKLDISFRTLTHDQYNKYTCIRVKERLIEVSHSYLTASFETEQLGVGNVISERWLLDNNIAPAIISEIASSSIDHLTSQFCVYGKHNGHLVDFDSQARDIGFRGSRSMNLSRGSRSIISSRISCFSFWAYFEDEAEALIAHSLISSIGKPDVFISKL